MQEFNEQIRIYEEILHIVHATASSILQDRDEETQTVVRMIAQVDKRWNGLRVKIEKGGLLKLKVKLRSPDDVERWEFEEKVISSSVF